MNAMKLEQGDLKLLESELAGRLLASTIPARYAYTALDGRHASWGAGSYGRAMSS